MTQNEKDLLLKDLCARLPYGVKGNYQNSDDELLRKVTIMYGYLKPNGMVMTGDIKPYLFPLSSITEEQINELAKLGVSYGDYALHDSIFRLGISVDEAYIFFEFCYKHHIDFLGLIDLGLAIDATGLNIY